MNQSSNVRALWAMYAGYYRQTISDDVLAMYAEDLADFTYEQIKSAMDRYRRDPKNRMLPMPAQIRDILAPTVDHDSAAREIAGRIVEAIKRFGWPEPARARDFMGEIGWQIVERSGGWPNLCQNHGTTIDPTSFHAQARDQAKASLKYSPHALNLAITPRSGMSTAADVIQLLGTPK